jgi:hypothetical protein
MRYEQNKHANVEFVLITPLQRWLHHFYPGYYLLYHTHVFTLIQSQGRGLEVITVSWQSKNFRPRPSVHLRTHPLTRQTRYPRSLLTGRPMALWGVLPSVSCRNFSATEEFLYSLILAMHFHCLLYFRYFGTHPLTAVAYRSNSWDAAKPVSWLHFAAKTTREAHCTDISTLIISAQN